MGWFTRIDEELLKWEVAQWKWLIDSLQLGHDINRIRLIAPAPSDFPVTGATAEDRASETFKCVQKYIGLESWPCTLVPFEEAGDVMRNVLPAFARPERC